MASYTPNLGLIKPSGSDNVAIAQLNANMDVLDEEVHENTQKIDGLRISNPPYIDDTTFHWMIWDPDTNAYVDSGYSAVGRPAQMSAVATTLPPGSDATASVTGTVDAPVLNLGIPQGATGAAGAIGAAAGFGTPTASVDANTGTPSVTVTASGPDTAKVFDFAFHNLKGPTGDPTSSTAETIPMSSTDSTTIAQAIASAGQVDSVNGQTGTVVLDADDIESGVVASGNSVEDDLSSLSQQIENLENMCNRNAGFHNSIFRGKSLGNSLTAEQKTAIQNGTFDDLFIGDYWTIGGIDYVICHFDYYYNCSDSNIDYHHVVVMPRGTMTGLSITLLDGEYSGAYKWNSSNTTAGGYIASRMRTVIMPACDTIVKAAFGSGNVHAISELYPSAFVSTTDGRATSGAWTSTDLICDLCNETMVYGQQVWGLGGAFGQQGFEVGIDKWQLAIFRLYPAFANTRAYWWLRSVSSASDAAFVDVIGSAYHDSTSYPLGVRPRFLVS